MDLEKIQEKSDFKQQLYFDLGFIRHITTNKYNNLPIKYIIIPNSQTMTKYELKETVIPKTYK